MSSGMDRAVIGRQLHHVEAAMHQSSLVGRDNCHTAPRHKPVLASASVTCQT
jgi:hypothetical protein